MKPSSYFTTPLPTIDATGIGMVTMVGHRQDKSPPYPHGNCFGVIDADGHEHRVVNFAYENMIALLGHKAPIPWPIRCVVVGEPKDRRVAIHDPRIPSSWYQQRWCEVCCPNRLLPMPQRLAGALRIDQGIEVEHPADPPKRRAKGEIPDISIAMTSIDMGKIVTTGLPSVSKLIPEVAKLEAAVNKAAQKDRKSLPLARRKLLGCLMAAVDGYLADTNTHRSQVKERRAEIRKQVMAIGRVKRGWLFNGRWPGILTTAVNQLSCP